MSREKVLIIRFNSIGDIVLTSPVAANLAQAGFEVHYLTKTAFRGLVSPSPYVFKVWELKDDFKSLLNILKQVKFKLVFDLHNNLRSRRVKAALGVSSYTLKKDRLGLWALTQLNIPLANSKHIVDRYLEVIEEANIKTGIRKTEFYFEKDLRTNHLEARLPESFVVISIGAAWFTKQIPNEKLIEIIQGFRSCGIILIGGPTDIAKSKQLTSKVDKKITNLVGELSIAESAWVIQRSKVLVTGDSGMMHIGAALKVKQVAVFGSTHPVLGYTPYYGEDNFDFALVQNENLKCRPCTKQGKNRCPKGHFKCMQNLDSKQIIDEMNRLI